MTPNTYLAIGLLILFFVPLLAVALSIAVNKLRPAVEVRPVVEDAGEYE